MRVNWYLGWRKLCWHNQNTTIGRNCNQPGVEQLCLKSIVFNLVLVHRGSRRATTNVVTLVEVSCSLRGCTKRLDCNSNPPGDKSAGLENYAGWIRLGQARFIGRCFIAGAIYPPVVFGVMYELFMNGT